MTSSIADQSIKDAEFEKFFQTYVDTQSSALVDPGKIQALAEFYLPSIAFYGWFGEVHSEQNSRDDVMAHHSERLQEMKKNNPQLNEVEIKPEKFVYHVSDDKLHGWSHGIYSIHMKDASGSEFKQEKARFSYTCHRMQGQGPWKIAHAHVSQAHKSQA